MGIQTTSDRRVTTEAPNEPENSSIGFETATKYYLETLRKHANAEIERAKFQSNPKNNVYQNHSFNPERPMVSHSSD